MKILCICPIGIGNYLLAYPACAMLRKALPGAVFDLLALRRAIMDIALRDPIWNQIFAIDPAQKPDLAEQMEFMNRLSREKYDASLCFFPSNNWQYNFLPFFCRIGKRYAFDYPLKKGASLGFLNNHLVPVDPVLHDVNQNLRLVESFTGTDPTIDEPLVFPRLFTAEEKDEARKMLAGSKGPRTFVGIHAGSSGEHGMEAKRWDPMRFGELVNRICGGLGATQALIFGGPDEEKLKHVVASVVTVPHRIIDSCTLSLTAALISECSLFLCNDSGLMHMAACMKVPVAAIFGPTDERRNGPVGGETIVVRKEMEGFPLWTAATAGVRVIKGDIDPQASLKALTVDDAWKKIQPWLQRLTPMTV